MRMAFERVGAVITELAQVGSSMGRVVCAGTRSPNSADPAFCDLCRQRPYVRKSRTIAER